MPSSRKRRSARSEYATSASTSPRPSAAIERAMSAIASRARSSSRSNTVCARAASLLAAVEVALPPSDLRLRRAVPGPAVPRRRPRIGPARPAASGAPRSGGRGSASRRARRTPPSATRGRRHRRRAPRRGGTNVVVLLVLRLPVADQPPGEPIVRPACEPICVPARMPRAELVHDSFMLELLVGVVADRLEHEEARLAVGLHFRAQEAVLEQCVDTVSRSRVADRLGCVETETSGEDAQACEQLLLVRVEEVEAPVERARAASAGARAGRARRRGAARAAGRGARAAPAAGAA